MKEQQKIVRFLKKNRFLLCSCHVHYDFPKDLCVVCLFFLDDKSLFAVPIGQVDS